MLRDQTRPILRAEPQKLTAGHRADDEQWFRA
jgi:hypothetical protein